MGVEDLEENSEEKMADSTPVEKKKRSFLGIFAEISVYCLIAVLCILVVPRYVLQRTEVEGRSMENTLENYDNLLVEKVTYYFKEPERFDIVTLYPNGRNSSEYYIKRIIGLPGENVRIEENQIFINGEPLKENFGKEALILDGGKAEGIGVTLGEDEYFVMGDNRNHSIDSRFEVGPVKKENIDGHAVFRICSFGKKKDGKRGSISFKNFGTLD